MTNQSIDFIHSSNDLVTAFERNTHIHTYQETNSKKECYMMCVYVLRLFIEIIWNEKQQQSMA